MDNIAIDLDPDTYVMIKTHNITGLKYLCKTQKPDPYAYKGSGIYWKQHLKKHGNNITTQVILRSSCKVELEDFCLEMSRVLDVVSDKSWANLVPENGLDGAVIGTKYSDEHKAKMSAAHIGKVLSDETKAKMSTAKLNMSDETKAKMSAAHKGKVFSDETKAKLSAANKGKKREPFSDEHKAKLSAASKGRKRAPLSDEHKAKLSAVKKGKVCSDETKAKLSAASKGKVVSDETRAKMSIAALKRKRIKQEK